MGAQFISRRSGDRLGLILFGSNAYVQSPLSFDTDTVKRFLQEAQIGFAGPETAIGDAIGLAVKRLKERPAESRVLILLTDGQDTASSVQPLDAAQLAATWASVSTPSVSVPIELTLPGLFGSSFGSRQVNPSAELDEAGLQEIASSPGGSISAPATRRNWSTSTSYWINWSPWNRKRHLPTPPGAGLPAPARRIVAELPAGAATQLARLRWRRIGGPRLREGR